ncbi:hypothetical protein QBC37DRAFT_455776 [Rhypophila decipiens]|uniref:DUF7791 domain-containing protein n=1 Tax=Rhypophila decipiens TaxID=261697 RepID=A0AAN6XUZ3_9PEZI|nr:hypothetical protein QBC37DRAFT_455776 [Rhypophila decipiens]
MEPSNAPSTPTVVIKPIAPTSSLPGDSWTSRRRFKPLSSEPADQAAVDVLRHLRLLETSLPDTKGDQEQAHLDQMPTKLNELYSRIIHHAIPFDLRPEASRIFQLFHASYPVESAIRGHAGLLAIQAAFALGLDSSANDELGAVSQKVSSRQEKRMIAKVKDLLLTRCCGLLDVHNRKSTSSKRDRKRESRARSLAEHVLAIGSKPVRPHIGFIHHTVAEFMKDQKAWAEISSWGAISQHGRRGGTEDNHYQALFKSCIAMAKRFPTSEVVHPRGSPVWESTYTGMRYAQLAEQSGQPVSVEDLDAFDRVFGHHWNKAQVYYQDEGKYESVQGRHWSSLFFHLSDGETPDGGPTWMHNVRSNRDHGFRRLDSSSETDYEMVQSSEDLGFLRLAVVYGLGSYVRDKLTAPDATRGQTADILKFWQDLFRSSFPLRLKVPVGRSLASFLLHFGIQAGSASDMKFSDAEDTFTLWNIILMELCSARDLGNMTKAEACELATLASQFLKLPVVLQAVGTGSGRFGNLLLQLGAVLKSKQRDKPGASGPGLLEMLQEAVAAVEAKYTTVKNDKPTDNILRMKMALANRPIGRGSTLKRQFSPDTTPSKSSSSEATTGSSTGSTTPSGSSPGSLARFGFGSFGDLTMNWSTSVSGTKEVGGERISGQRMLQKIRKETRKLKLPLAKKRAVWREWEVAGVQPISHLRG